MRDFASGELGLPESGSYRRYADIGRRYVVWSVFAAEPLSVDARQWCFPFAGCVRYRGYFSEAAADAFASEVRAEGVDVHVVGVPAYSTLGWFDDPILNTFISYPEIQLAHLMFHELAHQVAYVRDDTRFNESFAETVAETGVMRWIDVHGTPAQREAFIRMRSLRADFYSLVKATRADLAQLYTAPGTPNEKLAGKVRRLAQLKSDYQTLRSGRWGGYAGYDRWFGNEINNATLASVGLYFDLVPAFRVLLAECGGDLRRFYASVRELAELPIDRREAQLRAAAGKAVQLQDGVDSPPAQAAANDN